MSRSNKEQDTYAKMLLIVNAGLQKNAETAVNSDPIIRKLKEQETALLAQAAAIGRERTLDNRAKYQKVQSDYNTIRGAIEAQEMKHYKVKDYQNFLNTSKGFNQYDNSTKEGILASNADKIIMARYNADPKDPVNIAAKEALDQAKKDFQGATKNQQAAIVMNRVAIVAAMDGNEDAYEKLHKEAKELSNEDDAIDLKAAMASAQRWDRTKGILIRVGIALAVGAAVAFMVICPPAAALTFVTLVTPFAIQAAAIAVSAASVFLANMAGNVVIALAALCAIKVGGKMMGNETPLKDFFKGIAHGVAWVLKLPYTAVDRVAEFVSPSKTIKENFGNTFSNEFQQKSVEGKTESFKAALDGVKKSSPVGEEKGELGNTDRHEPNTTTRHTL